MFEKSDKTMFNLRVAMVLLFIVMSVLYLILGIISCVNGFAAEGISYIFLALVLPIFGWVLLSFTLACAADIKAIRNAIYDSSNAPISEFLTENFKETRASVFKTSGNDALHSKLESLKLLKELLDTGALTADEYTKLKQKYIDET